MFGLMAFGCLGYLVATEYISAERSKGEVLLFRRNRMPTLGSKNDEESHGDDRINANLLAREQAVPGGATAAIHQQTAAFHWDGVCYDIKVNKKEDRRLLDEVDGWVKPGTLTALMVRSLPLLSLFSSESNTTLLIRLLSGCYRSRKDHAP